MQHQHEFSPPPPIFVSSTIPVPARCLIPQIPTSETLLPELPLYVCKHFFYLMVSFMHASRFTWLFIFLINCIQFSADQLWVHCSPGRSIGSLAIKQDRTILDFKKKFLSWEMRDRRERERFVCFLLFFIFLQCLKQEVLLVSLSLPSTPIDPPHKHPHKTAETTTYWQASHRHCVFLLSCVGKKRQSVTMTCNCYRCPGSITSAALFVDFLWEWKVVLVYCRHVHFDWQVCYLVVKRSRGEEVMEY